MNKELSLRTLAYLVGYYKTHNGTIINLEEIEAINFILDENEQLQQELDKKNKIIEEIKNIIELNQYNYGYQIKQEIEELEKGSEE